MQKRMFIYPILGVVYVCFLLLLFVDLPSRTIQEQGSVDFFSCQEVNCAQLHVDLIEQANEVACAFYDLEDEQIISSLLAHKAASVKIYEDNGLPYFDNVSSKGLMHHKFCVFNNQITIMGSYNPTHRGTYLNDNYVLVIDSPTIANYFLEEFKQIGEIKKDKSRPPLNLSGTIIQVCFSPQEACEQKIIEKLETAQNTIDFLAFSFTSNTIANTLIEQHKKGIIVRGIFEKTRISQYSVYSDLLAVNISVFLDGNSATMHEKLFILDNKTIIVGSYNPTNNAANNNDENLLIITNQELVRAARDEFNRITAGLNTET